MPYFPDIKIPRERIIGSTLSGLARAAERITEPLTPYAQGYGPEFVNLSDLADIPTSRWEAGLTLAGMLPVGKAIKAVRRARPELPTHMSKMPWEATEAEWNKLKDYEPPIPEGHTRLYRGENVTSEPQKRGMKGNWFSTSREAAETFAWESHFAGRGQGKSRVTFVDVPTDVYVKNEAAWFPTSHPWHERYKTRSGKVYSDTVYGAEDAVVLPHEWASKRQELFRTYDWEKAQKLKPKK